MSINLATKWLHMSKRWFFASISFERNNIYKTTRICSIQGINSIVDNFYVKYRIYVSIINHTFDSFYNSLIIFFGNKILF